MKRIVALCLCAALLLSGCALRDFFPDESLLGILLNRLHAGDGVAYEDMEYTRPDLQEHDRVLEESCQVARTARNIDDVVDAIYAYYDEYDWFYTCYSLAYIEYCRDVTSDYWSEEYAFCAQQIAQADAGLEQLFMALAQSPIRNVLETDEYYGPGFFDSYEGEATWDEGFMALLEEESRLLNAYYDLCEEAEAEESYSEAYFDRYADRLCQALIDLVHVRREMADYFGYDSYAQFAYDFYYYRDYTPEQAMDYLDEIAAELAPLYRDLCVSDVWDGGFGYCSETETFAYVREAARAMGGTVEEAFDLMVEAGLYDIAYSENKFPTSFEIYLDSYYQPYVFVCPYGYERDKLTFAHEFGHFATDYAAWGSYAGTDVMEVFSQGMEYLSLCYVEGNEDLARYKLADCVSVFVEQAAYACFEQKLYELPVWDLNVETVYALYGDTCRSFGIDFEVVGWDERDLVTTPHFYTDPMYIISYVVSNDAAFQIYERELDQSGQGLALYQDHLATECSYFLEFVEEAGLESPFTPGRVARTARTLEELLGK